MLAFLFFLTGCILPPKYIATLDSEKIKRVRDIELCKAYTSGEKYRTEAVMAEATIRGIDCNKYIEAYSRKRKLAQTPAPSTKPKTSLENSKTSQANTNKNVPTITYEGYSKQFIPIKDLIAKGNFDQAYLIEQNKIAQDDADFLNSIEAGILAIDANNMLEATEHFATAEKVLKQESDSSVVEGSLATFGLEALSMISGFGELTTYSGEPYERILMLNYKSITYLLNGERKAYNVTRRAIDWQNIEKKEFDKNIGEAEKELQEEQGKLDDEKNISAYTNIFAAIASQYKSSKSRALSVPSAYINPFGFYMAGIVQEFDSYDDASLRDNAQISYKKALELNPKSKVIKQAIKGTRKAAPKNRRLVHVIVADGFAPEKKTLTFNLNVRDSLVPVKLALFEPVKSSVAKIKIKSGKRTLATFSEIADIEAITLRHQLDSLPLQHARVAVSVFRNIAENELLKGIGGYAGAIGMIVKQVRDGFANPDMRAWMSLPKTLSAARIYVRNSQKTIAIVSYDKKGRILAKKKIKLNKKSHNFIYVRSLEKNLYAKINKNLWIASK